jgi:hypothetical protein
MQILFGMSHKLTKAIGAAKKIGFPILPNLTRGLVFGNYHPADGILLGVKVLLLAILHDLHSFIRFFQYAVH